MVQLGASARCLARVAVRVPGLAEEAARDLVRARKDVCGYLMGARRWRRRCSAKHCSFGPGYLAPPE